MINIGPYDEPFEEEFWKTVNKKINSTIQNDIIKSCKKYLPPDFFTSDNNCFKELILSSFNKLNRAKEYMKKPKYKNIMRTECFDRDEKRKYPYENIHDAYEDVVNSSKKGTKMRVRMVKNLNLNVCPYCNRDYINFRAKNVSGAQLDHFFNRADYPLFSICLYNLVPVCGNCNRTKSDKNMDFASPFDLSVDWENGIKFSYKMKSLDEAELIINTMESLENNIKEMRIREAYKIHDVDVKELLDKKRIYSETQTQEFENVLCKMGLTNQDIRRAIFSPEITTEMMKNKPLGKMMHDLQKELEIY